MKCLLCEQPLARKPTWQALLGIEKNETICESCSNSFKRADIKEEGKTLDAVHSLFIYNEAMREYLHQYKFLADIALADVFTEQLADALKGKKNIVPIPMHPEKKIERTFAHVDELLKRAEIPFTHLLEKTGTDVMGEKSRDERLAMKQLFKVKQEATIERATYVLVDDIYTTGTTLNSVATALKEAGAARVEAVTLIRA